MAISPLPSATIFCAVDSRACMLILCCSISSCVSPAYLGSAPHTILLVDPDLELRDTRRFLLAALNLPVEAVRCSSEVFALTPESDYGLVAGFCCLVRVAKVWTLRSTTIESIRSVIGRLSRMPVNACSPRRDLERSPRRFSVQCTCGWHQAEPAPRESGIPLLSTIILHR
jgi:hypothetical protein